jgi:ribosome-associated translation inhibitor RaiA
MSDGGKRPAPILAQRLRLGPGLRAADRGHVLELLSALDRHLAHWAPERVDLEILVKDRGGPEQKVTLEAWLPGWPSLVATAEATDLDRALVDARKEMVRRIEDEKARRHLRRPRRGHGE